MMITEEWSKALTLGMPQGACPRGAFQPEHQVLERPMWWTWIWIGTLEKVGPGEGLLSVGEQVPTLGEWGTVFFTGLLAITALYFLRKRGLAQ